MLPNDILHHTLFINKICNQKIIRKYKIVKELNFYGKYKGYINISCSKPDFACKLIQFYLNLLTIPNLHF